MPIENRAAAPAPPISQPPTKPSSNPPATADDGELSASLSASALSEISPSRFNGAASAPTASIESASEPAPAPPDPQAAPSAPRQSAAQLIARRQLLRRLNLRRTLIPVLLTFGVLFPVFGILQFLIDPDSPLSAHHAMWMPLSLFTFGAVMLALAVMNILYVRDQLASQ